MKLLQNKMIFNPKKEELTHYIILDRRFLLTTLTIDALLFLSSASFLSFSRRYSCSSGVKTDS